MPSPAPINSSIRTEESIADSMRPTALLPGKWITGTPENKVSAAVAPELYS